MSWWTELSAAVFGQILILVSFFFWSCLKNKVYDTKPQTQELKGNIRMEIPNIPAEELRKVCVMSACREIAFSTHL
jgi:hypothetical protein